MEDVEERVYEIEKGEKKKLDDLLIADPYATPSFARVSPQTKEIEGKVYLYIKAESSFFKWADEKLKALTTVKRTSKEDEGKVIKMIREEEEAAAGGFGGIFG